jgi:cytidyltransferase-like protein
MAKAQTVFVSGNFNILHPGHLRLLRFARELGDHLIVGVNSDNYGGDTVHVSEQLRLEGVQSNNWVSTGSWLTYVIKSWPPLPYRY